MNQPSLKLGALIGGLTSLPLMALFYLGEQIASLPFVPFDLFDWLARVLPGDLIVLVIQVIVSFISLFNLGETSQTAKIIEQLMALGQFVLLGAFLGSSIAWLIPHSNQSGRQNGLLAGTVLFFLSLLVVVQLSNPGILEIVWLAVSFVVWGGFIGSRLTSQAADVGEENRAARRAMLIKLAGGSAGLAIGAWGLGRLLDSGPEGVGAAQPLAPSNSASVPTPSGGTSDPASAATTRDRLAPAPGTRDELTSNENFYRIDINTRPPVIKEENWKLETDGLFDNPRPLSLEDLTNYPAVTQPVTMGCISNRVGGDLIGTSNWTGVRLRDVLAGLGILDGAKYLKVEAVDSFFETVSMMDMFDPRTLLVYGMNGETLPVEHGFPLRIYIPDRYGMKQPKWITRITALAEDVDGYWVIRGWSKEARPQIVSVIDTIDIDEPTAEGLIPIGGIAWAGDRGIRKVELQFDDGEWIEAILRTPPLSPLTWVHWRYDWPASSGSYSVRVRATDGTGALQIEESQGTRPDGATGYHSKRVRI
jgi:DMSO/TMAO reductase YedYZ molybdopterin-dependent catalytic subunit